MVAGFVQPRRSIVMVILDRNTVKRASAARNEGSDEPMLIHVVWMDALATTTTVVDACRSAPHRRGCDASLPHDVRLIRWIRWVRWLLTRSSTVSSKFPSAGAAASRPISATTYHGE
eukprot:scaffold4438_cov56-Cyclotella_meneghiniana.AAC.7